MDIVSVLSTTVLVTTIATLVMAIAAYFAYKLKEWRKPRSSGGDKIVSNEVIKPIFLKRHMLVDSALKEHDVDD